MPTTFTPTRPVEAHGESLAMLTFREPTGRDLVACGFPVRPDGGFEVEAMNRFVARLTGVPPSSIGDLTAADWTACAVLAANFLAPTEAPSSSTDTTTQPTSGAAT